MQNEFLKLIEDATFYSFEPIISHPVFKDWVKKETAETGITKTDEEYCYSPDSSDLDAAIGARLSWICPIIGLPETVLEDGDNATYAGEMDIDGDKYWVITVTGNGSITWIANDTAYQKMHTEMV